MPDKQRLLDECLQDKHWRDFLAEAARVFPGTYVSSVQIQKGDTMAFFRFTKEEIDNQQGFDLLPNGKYVAVVMDYDWKETKDKTGHYLALTFEIIGPECVGRKVFENFNLDNTNEVAARIAGRAFRDLCDAVGMRQFCDELYEVQSEEDLEKYLDTIPEVLFDQPVEINVGIQKSKDPAYNDQNKIKSYASVKKMDAEPPKWKK